MKVKNHKKKVLSLISPPLIAGAVLCAVLVGPVFSSGARFSAGDRESAYADSIKRNPAVLTMPDAAPVAGSAAALYDSLNLEEQGLNEKAFEYALKGSQILSQRGQLNNTDIISICDFSQSSRKKRLYVIDLESKKVLLNTYVAHGKNSGTEYANSFSNSPESHKSSLGFYVTENAYNGEHGLALRIKGVEKGINDRAFERAIVIHGANYVNDQFIRKNSFLGRSFGCPAISFKDHAKLINTIKGGTCLFIYHPTKQYISKSKIINT